MSEFEVKRDQTIKFEQKKVNELHDLDDWGSSWEDCKRLGEKWGGRGKGGRATGRQTVQSHDVVVEGCTLIYLGNNLLNRTTLRLIQGHRYGLIGRNGVGKSTLMSRIATGTLPGFPPHLRVSLVAQELPVVPNDTITAVDFVVHLNNDKEEIMKQIERIENSDYQEDETYDAEEEAQILSDLYEAIEDVGILTAKAIKILTDLGFSEKRRNTPVASMSGGWKMRCSIAAALTQEPNILLLDEPTNHLDLEGVEWLKSYLTSPAVADMTFLVVSHDKSFLDDVCTDIIRFAYQQLHYYPGNYTAYEVAHSDKESHNRSLQATLDKKRAKMEESLRKMQVIAHKSDSASGAVANRKKKLNRMGVEKNEKGFRFRVQQDSYHGMSSIRAGSHNETAMGSKTGECRNVCESVEKEFTMTLPNPLPLSTNGSYFQLRQATLGYALNGAPKPDLPLSSIPAYVPLVSNAVRGKKKSSVVQNTAPIPMESTDEFKVILNDITIDIEASTKIGLVGKNGCGKSTLLKIIDEYETGGSNVNDANSNGASPCLGRGSIFKANHLRVAYYQQHQQDALPYEASPLNYFQELASKMASLGYVEQTIRAHLGSFGIGGDLVSRPIGTLSGGQKSRLVLAELTFSKPHVLLLDEPTNNLDLDTVKALTDALKAFTGAYIVASHDMSFVASTCDTVYHIHKGNMVRLENGVQEYVRFVKNVVTASKNKK